MSNQFPVYPKAHPVPGPIPGPGVSPAAPRVVPPATAPFRPDPARHGFVPGLGPERDRPRTAVEGKKLIVGRDIELSGNINACDTLVVEGRVQSDIRDASTIEVAQPGVFVGSAEVDHAEIAGTFEGELIVHKKLAVTRSGRIIGKVRYATLEIEAGGQIHGSAEVLGREEADGRSNRQPKAVQGNGVSAVGNS